MYEQVTNVNATTLRVTDTNGGPISFDVDSSGPSLDTARATAICGRWGK
jgi:hypothetical protein